jgi:UDPglucose 6-dehydrogenase
MNELAVLAEKLGADIEQVRHGIGSDPRIGYQFLYAGCGYGGSSFPKDVQALQRTAQDNGMQLRVLQAVEQVNHDQKRLLLVKVVRRFGERLAGRRFALWGLAFKANTDDMREAPSRAVIDGLLERGARVLAYDPAAEQEARRLYAGQAGLDYAATPMAALDGADGLIIVTEWKVFRSPDFEDIRSRLREPVLFDGRYLYDPALVRNAGLEYHGVGRGTSA